MIQLIGASPKRNANGLMIGLSPRAALTALVHDSLPTLTQFAIIRFVESNVYRCVILSETVEMSVVRKCVRVVWGNL